MKKHATELKSAPKRPLSTIERQATRANLKLLARGNPHRDEIMAAEADLAEAMMDDYRYFQDAEFDWFDERAHDPEPRPPLYADEEAWGLDEDWGLKYSRVDEDDSLMR